MPSSFESRTTVRRGFRDVLAGAGEAVNIGMSEAPVTAKGLPIQDEGVALSVEAEDGQLVHRPFADDVDFHGVNRGAPSAGR